MSGSQINLPPIILASASPRRSELLRQIGIEFSVVTSDTPEIHDGELTAREIAQVNAYRKARNVAKKHPDALVLGADTLVFIETLLLGKPGSLEHAYQMLEQLTYVQIGDRSTSRPRGRAPSSSATACRARTTRMVRPSSLLILTSCNTNLCPYSPHAACR